MPQPGGETAPTISAFLAPLPRDGSPGSAHAASGEQPGGSAPNTLCAPPLRAAVPAPGLGWLSEITQLSFRPAVAFLRCLGKPETEAQRPIPTCVFSHKTSFHFQSSSASQ